jgi:3-oxoadipate enol-lactonase
MRRSLDEACWHGCHLPPPQRDVLQRRFLPRMNDGVSAPRQNDVMPKSAADTFIWIPEQNAYENGKTPRALYRVVSDRFRCYHIERGTVKERSSDMSNTKHVQTGFAEINGTTLYYEVAGAGHPFVLVHGHLLDRRSWDDQFAVFAGHYRVIRYDQRGFGDSGLITQGESYSDRQDLYALMKFLGIESAYLMGVSGGGALAIDFTLEHPEMVDALIPVTAGVSGFRPSEEVMKKHPEVVRMYTSLDEAFEKHDIARAVEISLALWTDGPGRLPEQAAPEVRERVREMTTRNWERPDDEAQAQTPPVPLEPPAVGRLSKIGVPTLVILGELDGPNPLDQLAAEIPGAKKVIMAETAHHPFMEKPAEFNQLVLDFLGSLKS